MLSDVIIGICDLIGVVIPLETGVGHVFLIFSPGNLLGIEQIRDGGDIGGHLVEIITVHSKVVTTGRSTVVRLRRVSDTPVVAQCDALFGEILLVGITSGGGVILYFISHVTQHT